MAIGARVVTAEGRKIQVGMFKWYLGFCKVQVGPFRWYLVFRKSQVGGTVQVMFGILGKIRVGPFNWYLVFGGRFRWD